MKNRNLFENNGTYAFDICVMNTNRDEFASNNKSEIHFKVATFNKFINSRIDYVNGLKSLQNNWISSKESKKPSDDVIIYFESFLRNVKSWYADSGFKKYEIPKIVMSPIPLGGIYFSFKISNEYCAHVTISNSESVEVESEILGYYSDEEIPKDNLLLKLLENYNSVGSELAYPGR